MDGDGTRPRRPPAGRRRAGRPDLHLVRPHLHRTGPAQHRARRPAGQGRAVLAGERGRRLPPVQLRAGAHRAGGVAGGVRAPRLAARRGPADPAADHTCGRERRPGRPAPGAPLPGRATAPAAPPARRAARSVHRVSDSAGTTVGSVASISVYPVKSLGGRTVRTAEVDPAGLRGDRAWAVVDAGTGERITVKTTPQLREVVATGDAEADTITLTEVLGRPVRLARSEGGPQVDAAAVHLVSRGAISRAAEGDVPEGCSADDPRANVLLDLTGDADERAWVGRRLQVGEAVLDVVRTPKHCLGVYAEVRTPGRVAEGDAVVLTDELG